MVFSQLWTKAETIIYQYYFCFRGKYGIFSGNFSWKVIFSWLWKKKLATFLSIPSFLFRFSFEILSFVVICINACVCFQNITHGEVSVLDICIVKCVIINWKWNELQLFCHDWGKKGRSWENSNDSLIALEPQNVIYFPLKRKAPFCQEGEQICV